MMEELRTISAVELGSLLRQKKLGCAEVARYALERIASQEPALSAFAEVAEERALADAGAVQKRIDQGDETLSPLAGVPMALKDNICVRGLHAACGSRMLEDFIPPYSATAWERLEAGGAVLLGKTAMDEFAMGGSGENCAFGPIKNPWDVSRVPGGSSGGSAAAVASGEAFYALGSDTGGSLRQPCSFCGITGIKPTYGAVSRYGLIAYASSLDQIGPMGRNIRDCAQVLSLIWGRDRRDSTTVEEAGPDCPGCWGGGAEGLVIGLPEACFGGETQPEVKKAVLAAGRQLESMGARLVPVELPLQDYALPAYYIIACAEASSNLSRYDGIRYGYRAAEAENLTQLYEASRSRGFGREVQRRMLLGAFVLSSDRRDAYYTKALKVRELIGKSFRAALEQCDMILSPNAPTTAYPLGENIGDPLKMYRGDAYTVSASLSGLPAATAPCGFDSQGLPIGLQLIGRPFGEAALIRAVDAYQAATDFHQKIPGEVGR